MPSPIEEPMRARLEQALLLALIEPSAHTSRVLAVFPDNRVELTAGKIDVRKIVRLLAESLAGDCSEAPRMGHPGGSSPEVAA